MAPSPPTKAYTVPIIPMQNESPWLSQPPLLMNVVNTSLAFSCGPRVRRVIIIPKNPKMWIMRIRPSNFGRSQLAAVVIITPNAIMTQKSRVACQFCGT